MKIEEIELVETEYKTKRKFKHTGTLRLEQLLIEPGQRCAMEILMEICESIDCNFSEVLDAVNGTVR